MAIDFERDQVELKSQTFDIEMKLSVIKASNWLLICLIWLKIFYHVIKIELGFCKADFMVYDELAALTE